jgi:type IV pilus assembly protein PilV
MPLKSHGISSFPSHHRGFTLVEILVAVLVLAIGLLGLAGLQATTMRFNHSAYMRSQATNFAYDIADRMRVNRQAALNGDYDPENFEDPPPACTTPTLTGDLASQDIQEWRNALACALPLGTGKICRGPPADIDDPCNFDCSDSGSIFGIAIQWNDRDPNDPATCFVMTTDL